MTFQHVPVLLQETLFGLNIQPEGIYVDGTVGGAGHACEIAKQLHGAGRLIGLDRDPDAVAVATQRLAPYPATVIHANYDEMAQVLQRLEIPAVDGILLDLGVSSHQLDTEERGFSYHTDAPLDMRMSQSGMSAADVVNTWSQEELTRILFAYGEESFARAIARNICQARQEQPITTTLQLAEIVKSSVPQRVRRAKNPCKQTFQAIRIAVNDEFGHLERVSVAGAGAAAAGLLACGVSAVMWGTTAPTVKVSGCADSRVAAPAPPTARTSAMVSAAMAVTALRRAVPDRSNRFFICRLCLRISRWCSAVLHRAFAPCPGRARFYSTPPMGSG